MLFRFLFFSLVFCNTSHGQKLNGLWKGWSERSVLTLNPSALTLEIEVSNDTSINGIAHYYYKKGRYEHIKINGIISLKDSTVVITEDKELSYNLGPLYEICLGKLFLKLSQSGNSFFLTGRWEDKKRRLFRCPASAVKYEKPVEENKLLIKQGLLERPGRTTDVQKIIELTKEETDSVKIDIYDNGEIDNDTVSAYFNDSLLIGNARVSEIPLSFNISFDKRVQFQKIKLVAENLGNIPPNTALMIITTRKNRFTINLSSDYIQSGTVEFFLKE